MSGKKEFSNAVNVFNDIQFSNYFCPKNSMQVSRNISIFLFNVKFELMKQLFLDCHCTIGKLVPDKIFASTYLLCKLL